ADGRLQRRDFWVDESAGGGGLVNLSARALVGEGDRTAVVGWVIEGRTGGEYLIRGVGPGLAAFGVDAVVMAPRVRLFGEDIASDAVVGPWSEQMTPVEAMVRRGAFPLAPNSGDVALLRSFASGPHTAHLGS